MIEVTPEQWASLCRMVKEIHTTVLGNGKPEESLRARMVVLESKMKTLLWVFCSCVVGGIVVAIGKALS
jgi:hypothetical protein